MKKKLKNRKGFSLAEVLVAVLIMAMVTAVVAAGMPSAINAYHSIVDHANAQLLLTTTTNALRNELDLAKEITVGADGKTIDFRAPGGTMSRIVFSDGNSVTLYEYIGYASEVLNANGGNTQVTSEGFDRPLVSRATAPDTMNVRVDKIELNGNALTFTNLQVFKGTGEDAEVLAGTEKYTIHTEF